METVPFRKIPTLEISLNSGFLRGSCLCLEEKVVDVQKGV